MTNYNDTAEEGDQKKESHKKFRFFLTLSYMNEEVDNYTPDGQGVSIHAETVFRNVLNTNSKLVIYEILTTVDQGSIRRGFKKILSILT